VTSWIARAPIYLMKDMLENERRPTAQVVKHVDRCLSCCPVPPPAHRGGLSSAVDHAGLYRGQPPALAGRQADRRLLAFVLPHPSRFRAATALGRLARPLAPMFRRITA